MTQEETPDGRGPPTGPVKNVACHLKALRDETPIQHALLLQPSIGYQGCAEMKAI